MINTLYHSLTWRTITQFKAVLKSDVYAPLETHCLKSIQIRSFFCSVFSCIWTEYGDLRTKYPISVEIEENADLKKLRFWSFFMQWCNALIVKCQVIITLTNVGSCWNCHYFWIITLLRNLCYLLHTSKIPIMPLKGTKRC